MGGELTYEFSDHSIVLQPGDMAHIPAGEDHKHRPSVVGELQPLITPTLATKTIGAESACDGWQVRRTAAISSRSLSDRVPTIQALF